MAESPPSARAVQGWYGDPWEIEPLRWWDGETWTGLTARSGEDGANVADFQRRPPAGPGDPARSIPIAETRDQWPGTVKGWYPDPWRTGAVRWWNGHQWARRSSTVPSGGKIVATGGGYRFAAWAMTVLWAAGALGCLVGFGFVVSGLVFGTTTIGRAVGPLILLLFFTADCLFVAWICSRNLGRQTCFDAEGIWGLAISGPSRKLRHRLFPNVDRSNVPIRWKDIDHSELMYAPGAEGGGTYKVQVQLKDGRRGTAYAWSLRQSTIADLVDQFETVRQHASNPESGPLPLPGESMLTRDRSWKQRLAPHPRPSRFAVGWKVFLWIVAASGAIACAALFAAALAPSPGHHVQPIGAAVGIVLLAPVAWLGWYAHRIRRER